MLAITQTATDAIRSLAGTTESPGEAGLRITAGPEHRDEQPSLTVAVAEIPADGDEVVAEEDVRVFIEDEAISYLDGKILDVEVDESGRVAFFVRGL